VVCTREEEEVCMKEGVLAEAVLVPVPMHQNRKAACMTGEEVEGVGEAS